MNTCLSCGAWLDEDPHYEECPEILQLTQEEINELEISFYEYFIIAENPEMDLESVRKLAVKQWKEDREN